MGTTVKTLFTLKNYNFANSVIFAILDFLDFWVSCHFGFLLLWYHFANFTKPTLILRNFGSCLKPKLINITRLNPVQNLQKVQKPILAKKYELPQFPLKFINSSRTMMNEV